MGLFSGALGFLGSAYGSFREDKARRSASRANRRQIDQSLEFTDQALAAEDEGFARASPFMQLLLSTQQQAGARARGAIGRSSEAALSHLHENNRAAAAAGDAALGRRGLFNSTLALGNQRAAAADTNRQANQVLGQSGRALADVALQEGNAVGSAYAGLAGFEQARGAAKARHLGTKASTVGGVQHVAQQGIAQGYGGLGGALGGLFDSWLGKKKEA